MEKRDEKTCMLQIRHAWRLYNMQGRLSNTFPPRFRKPASMQDSIILKSNCQILPVALPGLSITGCIPVALAIQPDAQTW